MTSGRRVCVGGRMKWQRRRRSEEGGGRKKDETWSLEQMEQTGRSSGMVRRREKVQGRP